MHIKLSKVSRKRVAEICQKVKQANSKTPHWQDVANNTINFVGQNRAVTDYQANWICTQAAYHGLARPEELRDFKVKSRRKPNEQIQTESEFLFALLGHVKNLEDVIARHIQKAKGSSW